MTDPVLQHRVQAVEEAIAKLTTVTEKLVRLEERHIESRAAIERSFAAIEKQGKRIDQLREDFDEHRGEVDRQLPELKRASNWVFIAVAAIVGAAAAFVWRSATMKPAHPVPTPAAIVTPAVGLVRSSPIVS